MDLNHHGTMRSRTGEAKYAGHVAVSIGIRGWVVLCQEYEVMKRIVGTRLMARGEPGAIISEINYQICMPATPLTESSNLVYGLMGGVNTDNRLFALLMLDHEVVSAIALRH